MEVGSQAFVRFAAFALIFAAVALGEGVRPRRPRLFSRFVRWRSNGGLIGFNAVLLWLLRSFGPFAAAVGAEAAGWGVLRLADVPLWARVLVGVVVLDLTVYLQHVLFHALPTLWRLHMIHHADRDFDVTTGLRFHPVEIVLSLGIKGVIIVALGIPPVGVLVFEILLNGTAMFNHGNLKLPLKLDRILRLFVVTPDMHRVHHSVLGREMHRNFGFNLPWWDYLFRTYRAQPERGHDGMTIGLSEYTSPDPCRLSWILVTPFRRQARRPDFPPPS